MGARPKRRRWGPLLMLSLALAVAGTACREGAEAPAASGASRSRSPRPHDVLAGRVPVNLGAPSGPGPHRLLVDGAPGPALDNAGGGWLDTIALSDGLHQLQLSSGPASAAIPVVVLNHGSEVFFKNGHEGVVQGSGLEGEAEHLRFHWDMTSGVKQVLALLSWSGEGLDLELALGTGTCPHHGQRLAVAHGVRSPIHLAHRAPAKELSPEQWFVHVRLLNADAVIGRQAPFQVRAFLMR